jgi:homoserine kinase type II
MALRTRLSTEEARALLSEYGLALESIEPLPGAGTVNSNFRVRSSGGRYFLRLNEGKQESDVLAEVALVERLRASGVPTPAPLHAQDGRAVTHAAARPATLFPWVDGREAVADPGNPASARLIGNALAQVHRAGAGLGPTELPRNHYALDELDRRVESFADDLRVADLVPALRVEIARARHRRAPQQGAYGLIHQDLFPDNVLVDDAGQLVAVLDFEQATYGPLVYDLAVAINAWCWTGSTIAKPAVETLLGAYEAIRPLDERERARLVDEARLVAARFAITRITDVFLPADVDPDLRKRKDFREYIRRLEYWINQA